MLVLREGLDILFEAGKEGKKGKQIKLLLNAMRFPASYARSIQSVLISL